MATSPFTQIPEALNALGEDLIASDDLVDRLQCEPDATVRAGLSIELVRRTALVEDTMERAVYGVVEERSPELAAACRRRAIHLREQMMPIDDRTRNVAPIDVHTSDPEGFERALVDFEATLEDVRSWESRTLYPLLGDLGPSETAELARRVATARRHASEHPKPSGRVGRLLHKVQAKLEHFPDMADK
jgi:hypothetical protein